MNQQDELEKLIRKIDETTDGLGEWHDATEHLEWVRKELQGILNTSHPRLVETVEELDALPAGTVIRTDNTFPLEKVPNEFGTPWAYGAKLCTNRSVQLPATVLHLPEEKP
ncbi:hypothetical protein GS528_16420 [Rhodococcus hoagii]|nr:hypothetical protein [Prescottella equi]